jgi:23S rRNA (pseudouridine1915-N3)-methyltransferase
MRYRVVALGGKASRMKSAALRAACDDYLSRIRHYAKIEEREGTATRIPEDSRVVALTEQGESWSSSQLAELVGRWEMDGRDVTFVIGDADGLPDDVLGRAERRWSLGPLTLPHELARVVLYEQLYRAHTIRRGEKYHRGS